MRFVSIESLRNGMVLAKPLLGSNFEVLLEEGVALSARSVDRINKMGYFGVYIKEGRSQDIEVEDVIRPETRLRTIRRAKDVLREAATSSFSLGEPGGAHRQRAIVMPVIEDVISSRRRIVDMLDIRPFEEYFYYHTANMMVLSVLVGVEMGLSGRQLLDLGMGALLHDVGAMYIPKNILDKPGRLTPEEFEIVKNSSQLGFDFLKEHFEISIEACMGALQLHENFDGSGYPNRLSGQNISIYGRILAVTHVYDAMVSRRPYRPAKMPDEALEAIRKNTGTAFDPEVLRIFNRVVAPYPAGVTVELSDGQRCVVAENFPGDLTRPRLWVDDGGKAELNLHSDTSLRGLRIARTVI